MNYLFRPVVVVGVELTEVTSFTRLDINCVVVPSSANRERYPSAYNVHFFSLSGHVQKVKTTQKGHQDKRSNNREESLCYCCCLGISRYRLQLYP